MTHTYVFLDDVLTQDGTGFPDNWGHSGADYELDPDIVNDPLYSGTIKDDLQAIPTLSLVLDQDDMFASGGQGIYVQSTGSERATSVELVDPANAEEFQINAAVQIQGGSSTNRWKSDKLSLRLKFKEAYGPTKLDFPLFADSPVEKFDTLVLDATLNYGWTHPSHSQRVRPQYIRDQFVADLQNSLEGGHSFHGRWVHLYINGLYWGMYGVHERPDKSFASAYLGGDKEDYDVLKHGAGTVLSGSNATYNAMMSLAAGGLAGSAEYAQIQQYVDLSAFIDYMAINFYAGNTDWDHHNWYASRNNVDPSGRWRFHSWDAEHVLKGLNDDLTSKNNSGKPSFLHQQLLANEEYRVAFGDRAHQLFFNEGLLTPDKAAELYQRRLDEIDRAIVGESARWGDNRRPDQPYTRNNEWVAERDWLLNTYFPQRSDIVLQDFRDDDMYPNIVAPHFEVNGSLQHGGNVGSTDNLTLIVSGASPPGSEPIYYTTDGSDPRLVGGAVSPSAILYDGNPLSLAGVITINSRTLTGGEWSALNGAEFTIDGVSVAGNLKVTEVHYNPADPDVGRGN